MKKKNIGMNHHDDDEDFDDAGILARIPSQHRYIISEHPSELEDGDTYVIGSGMLLEYVDDGRYFILTQGGEEVGRIRYRGRG